MQTIDVCRVCHCEEEEGRPLFHPCNCSGSIKYVHQDCLVEWFKVSNKQHCELCGEKISFTKKYSPDTPKKLSEIGLDILQVIINAISTYGSLIIRLVLWVVLFPLVIALLAIGSIKFTIGIEITPLSVVSIYNMSLVTSWRWLLFWGIGIGWIIVGVGISFLVAISFHFLVLVRKLAE